MRSRPQPLTPERRLDPARQVRWLERLQDVVVRAEIQNLLLYGRPVFRGHHHDRSRGMAFLVPERQDGAISIKLGHQQIHDHEIDIVGRRDLESDLPVERLEDAVAIALEQEPHERSRGDLVVHDQDRRPRRAGSLRGPRLRLEAGALAIG